MSDWCEQCELSKDQCRCPAVVVPIATKRERLKARCDNCEEMTTDTLLLCARCAGRPFEEAERMRERYRGVCRNYGIAVVNATTLESKMARIKEKVSALPHEPFCYSMIDPTACDCPRGLVLAMIKEEGL